jgi:hypothetical protein
VTERLTTGNLSEDLAWLGDGWPTKAILIRVSSATGRRGRIVHQFTADGKEYLHHVLSSADRTDQGLANPSRKSKKARG